MSLCNSACASIYEVKSLNTFCIKIRIREKQTDKSVTCNTRVSERETHCCTNEVRVKTHTVAPQTHQLWGGKVSRHQSSDGFTAASSYNGSKVLHHTAKCSVLWRDRIYSVHIVWCKTGDIFFDNCGTSPPISFSNPLQDPLSIPPDT